jgi:Na+/proline symporter
MLFSYYQYNPAVAVPAAPDRIFPTFVKTHLPTGVSGLMIAAMLAAAMSTLSSSLNSLASTTVVDFYKPFIKRTATTAEQLQIAKWMTLVWGLILVCMAMLSRGVGSVLEAGLTIASITYGSMTGVFLLGVLTRRANERGSILGMMVGLLSMLLIWYEGSIAWTWYVLIGTSITFITGYTSSLLVRNQPETIGD